MPTTDPRIDAYIEKSAPFARPILTHIRAVLHGALPDVEETIKWGMPFFMYHGRPFGNMAAFKAHCAFGFWRGQEKRAADAPAMGQFGRLTAVKDLPPKAEFVKLAKQHAALIDSGEKPPARKATPKPALETPQDLLAALARNAKARKTFEAFRPSHQREYVEWIVEAKRAETREKRLAQAIEWMAEGKSRHWKYQGCSQRPKQAQTMSPTATII